HDEERERQPDEQVDERGAATLDAPAHERSDGDERPADEDAGESRPRLGPVLGLPRDGGTDGERGPRQRRREEAAPEEGVEPSGPGREPARAEQGDEPAADRVQRHQNEAQLGQVVLVPQRRLGEEERKRRAEQRHERDLAPEEALELALGVRLPHHPAISAQSGGRMTARVLIVDDHPLTREALGSLLAANGFDVAGQAAGALEAIELAQALQPGLIVLDLTMPDMDGLEALPRLRD